MQRSGSICFDYVGVMQFSLLTVVPAVLVVIIHSFLMLKKEQDLACSNAGS